MDEKLTKNSSMAGLFDEPIEPPPENFTKTVNTWAETTTMHGIASIAQSLHFFDKGPTVISRGTLIDFVGPLSIFRLKLQITLSVIIKNLKYD